MHTKTAGGNKGGFYSRRSILFFIALAASYLLLSGILIGFKVPQVCLVLLFAAFYFISPATRVFIFSFSIFLVYWIIFDFMKAFPNYKYRPVHIASLYQAEKYWFSIKSSGGCTPNEFFAARHWLWMDLLTGFFYICWVPLPLIFAIILYFKNRKGYFYFSLSFLLVNLVGFVIYYLYPAAPPWYVQQYGFHFYPGTPGNTAGLSRFDAYFNLRIFAGLYSQSSNVFAAMPSLHATYPLLVLFYGIRYRFGFWNLLFFLVTIGIWFAAVYNSHHYVLDILCGICCTAFTLVLFLFYAERTEIGKKQLASLVDATIKTTDQFS